MDAQIKERTRAEWRDLGFFYDRDDASKEWRLRGSRAGLLRFAEILRTYVSDPRNATKSEHEHYGPYMYLKVMTWPDAGMDANAIRGPLNDLRRLADLIEAKIGRAKAGAIVRIRDEFVPTSDYALVMELSGEDFDPASSDGNLAAGAG
jgi:hypothetical protein